MWCVSLILAPTSIVPISTGIGIPVGGVILGLSGVVSLFGVVFRVFRGRKGRKIKELVGVLGVLERGIMEFELRVSRAVRDGVVSSEEFGELQGIYRNVLEDVRVRVVKDRDEVDGKLKGEVMRELGFLKKKW